MIKKLIEYKFIRQQIYITHQLYTTVRVKNRTFYNLISSLTYIQMIKITYMSFVNNIIPLV